MGYSHYWNNEGHKDDEANFLKVVAEAKAMYAVLPEKTDTAGGYHANDPLKLCGGQGDGEPQFEERVICFNGDAELDLDLETFYVTPQPCHNKFCKTARKPYDLMVCAVLLSMKKHLVNFNFSSDGISNYPSLYGGKDWGPAKEFYQKVCGKK